MATRDNTVEFFSHDKDMRHDPKINALRIKFPGWGYTVWNMLLEVFSDSRERSIEWTDLNQELLAADFYIEKDMLADIVDYCIKLGLLQLENDVLKSQRFQERFGSLDELRETRSKSGKKGADARWAENRSRKAQNGDSMANAQDAIANDGKYSIEEKSIEEKRIETSSSFSSSSKPEEKAEAKEEQQQEIVSFFFFRNFDKPNAEFKKFLAWNNTGGRKWSDMDSIQRRAAAEQWKQKEKKPRFTQKFLDMWGDIYAALFDADAPEVVMDAALDDKIKWDDNHDGWFTLHCPKALYEFIEPENTGQPGFLSVLKPIISKYYSIRKLTYIFTD